MKENIMKSNREERLSFLQNSGVLLIEYCFSDEQISSKENSLF